jgi:DNA processing protein
MTDIYDVWLSAAMGVNCANSPQIFALGLKPKQLYGQKDDLKKYGIFSQKQIRRAKSTDIESIKEKAQIYTDKGISSINRWDEDFPRRFKNIAYMPLALYYKGDISLLSSKITVGIIGSRRCNGEGERACKTIARDVAIRSGVVISGLAQGVDSIAHRACIESGGRTVAFLGVPADECFPKANMSFQRLIEKEHLTVSEYIHGYEYYGANFIYRNRLIAAASDALCVIQAKHRSGSLSTVNRALDYDKPVFTIPGSIYSENYEGSNQLLCRGLAYRVTDGNYIMDYLRAPEIEENTVKKETEIDFSLLPSRAKTVYENLEGSMLSSAIVRKTGLEAAKVKAALTRLELSDIIERESNGEFIKKK